MNVDSVLTSTCPAASGAGPAVITGVSDRGCPGDAQLVSAAMGGDREAFAGIYDRYADRLHDFCLGMVRDPNTAADCVQETFCTAAARLGQLRDPNRLGPWLYAIARRQALRRIHDRRREQPYGELPEAVSGEPDPDTLAAHNELANLITEVADGLTDRDRTVLELAYRRGLAGPELADALGVTRDTLRTRMHRLHRTIERALGALLLARHARSGRGCAVLAAMLDDWHGQFTVLVRKQVARHIDACPACAQQRRQLVTPAVLFGYATAGSTAPGESAA